jgi:hypothetical protein
MKMHDERTAARGNDARASGRGGIGSGFGAMGMRRAGVGSFPSRSNLGCRSRWRSHLHLHLRC